MLKGRSRLAVMLVGLAALAGTSAAQVPESNTVGNPQLRDFELRGNTTLPAPPPSTTPVEITPPVTITPPPAPPPTVTRTPPADPAPRPTERRSAPAPTATPPTAARPQARPSSTAPAPEPTVSEPSPVLADDRPASAAPPPQQPRPSVAAPQDSGFPWLYVALGLLAAAVALAAARVFLRRRADEDETEETLPAQSAPEPKPQPVAAAPRPRPARPADPAPRPGPAPAAEPAAATISAGTIGIQVRPWIELEFKPDRAVATDSDTSVQFELVVRNTGNTGARNVRIEGRMFNAGREEEREIGAFFSEPLMTNNTTIPMLLPQASGSIRSAVSMPRTEVKEITLEGRRLFVPMVAFNVTYEWGENRSGQTSMSYLVGRETEARSEKMGAFRLDLGPRLYRSVGHRQTNLALVV